MSGRPSALTIAGSDSGGGAGIQADLKTFQRFGVFGTCALTLVTAQNTRGVRRVEILPAELVRDQIAAVAEDFQLGAAKTGALGSAEGVAAVAESVARHAIAPLVVDPVMVSKHGAPLLRQDAVEALAKLLLPRATLATPNLHEAAALLGGPVESERDMVEAARALQARGPQAVLVKGGHLSGAEALDVLFDGRALVRVTAPRVETRHTHGTGCTYSAAIAARLALGDDLERAVRAAKAFVSRAILRAPGLGAGQGPVDHGA